jgi:acetylornithine/succinyldiaminopimelate/putrescine aminotransferase
MYVLEKHTVSIFKAEVTMVGSGEISVRSEGETAGERGSTHRGTPLRCAVKVAVVMAEGEAGVPTA